MKIHFFACLLLASLCFSAFAANKINIISPKVLSAQFENTEGIEFSVAEYGEVPYGAQFIGGLVFANPRDACGPIKHFSAGEMTFDHNIIAVIRKGNCPVATKIMHAQNAGAKMVIMTLNVAESIFKTTGDAISGENINIPTIFISFKDGTKLTSYLENLKFPPVNPTDIVPMVSVSFPYIQVNSVVQLDLWYDVADPNSEAYTFITHLSQFIAENPAFKFVPHVVTWDCMECKAARYQTPIAGDCISGGRYCAPDPDGYGPLSGSDVVMEALKQMCLWKTNRKAWWVYTSFYPNQCLKESNAGIDMASCSKSMLEYSYPPGGNVSKVDDCIAGSFMPDPLSGKNTKELSENKVLRNERKWQLEYGITQFPVLLINKRPFSGNLSDINEVMAKVCKKVSPKPNICVELGFGDSKLIWRFGIIFFVIAAMTLSAAFLFGCYRKVIKRDLGVEMSAEANNMVSRYMAVHDLGLTEKGEEI